jgi:hypothetical protein
MSLPYVILTFNADALSILPVDEPGVEGTARRVDEEDEEEGVSGMEEKVEVKVEVPVVGREEVMGDVGE